jgi:uncharacterized protein (DUF2141 family)
MNRFALLLATAAIVAPTLASAESPGLLRRTVQTYYASNNRVQLAVFRDACVGWDMLKENRTARARLKRESDRRLYDLIASQLGDVYADVAEPTDANLEQVKVDFCSAASDR